MSNRKLLKRSFPFLLLLLLISSTGVAQYHAAVGLRAGKFGSGLTMKYFLYPDNASGFEIMFLRTKIANSAEESYGGWWLAAFYERQLPFDFPLIQLPLDFIAGIGTHVGYYPYRYFKIVEGNAEYYPDHTISMGIDLLIALEYVVPLESLPFAIGIEAQPFVEFLHRGPENLDFAVTLKYVFHTD